MAPSQDPSGPQRAHARLLVGALVMGVLGGGLGALLRRLQRSRVVGRVSRAVARGVAAQRHVQDPACGAVPAAARVSGQALPDLRLLDLHLLDRAFEVAAALLPARLRSGAPCPEAALALLAGALQVVSSAPAPDLRGVHRLLLDPDRLLGSLSASGEPRLCAAAAWASSLSDRELCGVLASLAGALHAPSGGAPG